MQAREYFLNEVYPKLRLPLAESYPLVGLRGGYGWRALGEAHALMLAALTGTGKSTALSLLKRRLGLGADDIIPSRRELTDWVLFPLAQALANESIQPVTDRVERFAITRRFAGQVEGGMAALFSWLYLHDSARGTAALGRHPRPQRARLCLAPLPQLADGRADAASFRALAPPEQPRRCFRFKRGAQPIWPFCRATCKTRRWNCCEEAKSATRH